MITVGEVYLNKIGDKSILCADTCICGLQETLYFAVNTKQKSLLNLQSGESFILGLLPYAMQIGESIVYKGQLSERFVHGLNEYMITSLNAAQKHYHCVRVSAEKYSNEKRSTAPGVGAGMVDCPGFRKLIQDHGGNGLYPVTHVCVFAGEDQDSTSQYRVAEFAAHTDDLETVIVEHNFSHLYRGLEPTTGAFLELAGALALSGGLGMYLFYSASALNNHEAKPKETRNLDLIISSFASTDKMRIYLFDYESEGEKYCAENRKTIY